MTDLHNKVALVTGSGRGIGRAIAQRYAHLGASVVINYASNQAAAAETAKAIEAMGGRALPLRADVSRLREQEEMFSRVLETFGRLDIVVANAGVEVVGQPVLDVTEADFDRVFAINAKGTFFTLQLAAKHVADNGRIIYVGTSNSTFPTPGHGLYGGSKAPGEFLVQVLSKEVGNRGVTVNTLLPTATDGAGLYADSVSEAMQEFVRSQRPIQRMGTVDDAADAAEFLAGDLAGFISGQRLLVSGGAPA
ncbi:SDR family oxidoreductase [Kribbella sp. NPDC023972]|uniref:SDR family oxidoreductase n=1 Tax=Kribbella sp. NPDC023972 TaxID=3154795 RepID=UPI0033DBE6E7